MIIEGCARRFVVQTPAFPPFPQHCDLVFASSISKGALRLLFFVSAPSSAGPFLIMCSAMWWCMASLPGRCHRPCPASCPRAMQCGGARLPPPLGDVPGPRLPAPCDVASLHSGCRGACSANGPRCSDVGRFGIPPPTVGHRGMHPPQLFSVATPRQSCKSGRPFCCLVMLCIHPGFH